MRLYPLCPEASTNALPESRRRSSSPRLLSHPHVASIWCIIRRGPCTWLVWVYNGGNFETFPEHFCEMQLGIP